MLCRYIHIDIKKAELKKQVVNGGIGTKKANLKHESTKKEK